MSERLLPFPEPGEAPGSEDPFEDDVTEDVSQGTRERPFAISDLNALSRTILEEAFSDIWIEGEISNFKPHPSGHHYFSLKDARAQVSAVMFRGANQHLKFRPAYGQSVLARGKVTLYEARGSYQVNVVWMEPLGAGSLQLAFEKLKAKLREEGLFDADRKRPIPHLPRGIGVVTSPTGAALHDILRVLDRRAAALPVLIAPCRVQGEGASREIAAAIASLNEAALRLPAPIDVLIVGRGGGSLEDLWAFNEEAVARAIAASRIPVISAVGHEVDITIADLVADLRAPTPSAAAEMVVKSRDDLLSRIDSARSRLVQSARFGILDRRARVETLARSRAFSRLESGLASARQRCDEATMRLGNALLGRLRRDRERVGIALERLSPRSLKAEVASRRERLASLDALLARGISARVTALREALSRKVAVLQSLSPLGVLQRGYAICQESASGAVVTDATTRKSGDEISVRLARGRLAARVVAVEEE